MSMCLKQHGLALLCIQASGSLHVPDALAHPSTVTLSFGNLTLTSYILQYLAIISFSLENLLNLVSICFFSSNRVTFKGFVE